MKCSMTVLGRTPTEWGAVLLAQGGDSLTTIGTGAWVGTGLLGAVLSWLLLKHLPEKDKQIKELIAEKDSLILAMLKEHNEERSAVGRERISEQQVRIHVAEIAQEGVKAMAAAFTAELKEEREICERRHKELIEKFDGFHREQMEAYERTHERVRAIGHEVANIAQDRANARSLEKMGVMPGKKGGQQP